MARTVIFGIISLWLVTAIIKQPDEAFQAALQGLTVWWNIVFPGLLPFLVLAELMLAFGAIHALSALLDPFMRRFAGLPGAAAWPLTLGWMTGYTAGAEAAALLRRKQAVSRADAEWLIAVSYMPSPMFMLVVIGSGFLHSPASGLFIALIVWLSAWIAAVILRFLAVDSARNKAAPPLMELRRLDNPFLRAGSALMAGRREDGRSFGKALGDAVTSGVQKLMTIGGFMIVFALVARLLQLSLPKRWAFLSFAGLYESHLGAYSASLLQSASGTAVSLAAIAAVLAWGGWSGLLQVRSCCTGTDLRFFPFVLARITHAALAFGLALALWPSVNRLFITALESRIAAVFAPGPVPGNGMLLPVRAQDLPSLWHHVPLVIAAITLTTAVITGASCLVWLLNRRRSV
ncbi:nucleoside recognition domain-containing protein [Paenibacillus tarimensis]